MSIRQRTYFMTLVGLAMGAAACSGSMESPGGELSAGAEPARLPGTEVIVDIGAKDESVSAGDVKAADFVSQGSGYVRHDIGACPEGSFLTGIHLGNDQFLCAWSNSLRTSEEFISSGNLDHGMGACPVGSVLTGLHRGRGLLLCTPHNDPIRGRYVDAATRREGMGACPDGMKMVGLHEGNGTILCEY